MNSEMQGERGAAVFCFAEAVILGGPDKPGHDDPKEGSGSGAYPCGPISLPSASR